jgi:hypothetical protein
MNYKEQVSEVSSGALSQYNASVCQSAAIAQALGYKTAAQIKEIRDELTQYGDAGSPANMAETIKARLKNGKNRYEYNGNASLLDMQNYIIKGCFLILHSSLTYSGHVFGLDEVFVNDKGFPDSFSAKDPWSRFNEKTLKYDYPDTSYDGNYSARLIYAFCVADESSYDRGVEIFRSGELLSARKGAWVHVIKP